MSKVAKTVAVVEKIERAAVVAQERGNNTMAEIKSFVFWRHLRAEPTTHILFFKNGALRASGRGLALWLTVAYHETRGASMGALDEVHRSVLRTLRLLKEWAPADSRPGQRPAA